MALTSSKLNDLLNRQKECEKQTKLLQKQVAAFQNKFGRDKKRNISSYDGNINNNFIVLFFDD